MITTLKEFGRGQITLPKKWRDKHETDLYIATDITEGLLIIPITDKLIKLDSKKLKKDANTASATFKKKSIRKKCR